MKRLFSFLVLFTLVTKVYSQNDIRSVEIKDIGGNDLAISSIASSKIVFIIIDASPSSIKYAKLLDSLVSSAKAVQVVGISVTDFGFLESDSALAQKYSKEGLRFPIVAGSRARKENAAQKNSLVSWLTNASKNRSYSLEVEEVGQLFILNEKRELYAVAKAKALENPERINSVLNQKFE